VIAQHNDDLMRVVRAALDDAAGEPIEAGVVRLVAAAIAAHRIDPDLHRVLAEQMPAGHENVDLYHREAYGLFRTYLDEHRSELPGLDLDLTAFICVTAIEALTHNAVIHRPDILTDGAAD